MELLVGYVASAALVLVLWYIFKFRLANRKIAEATREAEEITRASRQEAERIKKEKLLEGRDQIFRMRSETEKQLQEQKRALRDGERRLARKEDNMDQREQGLLQKEQGQESRLGEIQNRERLLEGERNKYKQLVAEQIQKLEVVAGMTAEEAKKVLIKSIENEAMRDGAFTAKRIEEEARQKAEQEARKIITQAIQRCAAEHVVESSVSVVDLPNDDMKGRIIGREGRNIRALEQATGWT